MWQPVQQLVPVLLGRHWTLEIARKPQLLSSDTPVVVWRRPSPRDQYEGVGVENAEEIRFPLDPGKQLVLTPTTDRPPAHRVEPGRVSACNADIASGCHRFIVGHPHRPRCLQRTTLALKRPVLRFNLGLLYTQGPPGTMVERGEVLHVWVPRRGANRA